LDFARGQFRLAVEHGTEAVNIAMAVGDGVTMGRIWFVSASQSALGDLSEAMTMLASAASRTDGRSLGSQRNVITATGLVLATAQGLSEDELPELLACGVEDEYAELFEFWLAMRFGTLEDPIGQLSQHTDLIDGGMVSSLFFSLIYLDLISGVGQAEVHDARLEKMQEDYAKVMVSITAFPSLGVESRNLSAAHAWRTKNSGIASSLLESHSVGDDSPFAPRISSSNQHTVGLLKLLVGDESGFEALENAISDCRKAGAKLELLRTLANYSEALIERDNPGDRDKATRLQVEAIAIATTLGMKPMLERVLAQIIGRTPRLCGTGAL